MEQHPRLSKTQPLKTRWRRFQRKVERHSRDEYESILASHFRPLQIFHGSDTRPTRLFFFTREDRLLGWKLQGAFPKNWHALVRVGIPAESILTTTRSYVHDTCLPLLFVGALKPLDLTVFAMLRSAIPVRYLGIDDRWLRLCRESLKPKFSIDRLTPLMRPLEREHFALVREMLPDLETLVGSRCFELLSSGRVFPFEAASNPGFYKDSFPKRLLAHLNRARAR